jgi:hypothetical protein
MCEACARKLLEMAFEAKPLPDQQGDGRASAALKEAAEAIRPISENEDWKRKHDEVRGSMLHYRDRCLKMASALHAFVHGKRPDGTSISPQAAIDDAVQLLGK